MRFIYDISVKDFQDLHILASWKYLDNKIIKGSLDNSMFKISVFEDDKCVGIARVVGDNFSHGLLCDVIVHPDYRKRGIGTAMIKELMAKIQEFTDDGKDEFMLELLPTKGNEDFYVKCGFKYAPENMSGAYKWFKNKNLYTETSKKHYMQLNEGPFNSISKGTKTIEMRLWDEKRQKIKPNDYIIFVNRNNFDQRLKAKVIALHNFESFADLYKKFDKISLGYQKNEQALPQDMEQYYPLEDIQKYGVVGIEIKLISKE